MAHDWHLIDAEEGVECRTRDDGQVELRRPDGQIEEMSWAEFDRWRRGGEDG